MSLQDTGLRCPMGFSFASPFPSYGFMAGRTDGGTRREGHERENATYTYGVNVVVLGVFVFVSLARVMVRSFRSLHDVFGTAWTMASYEVRTNPGHLSAHTQCC